MKLLQLGESFLNQTIAYISGDSAVVTAEKIKRQSSNALTSATSVTGGEIMDKKDALDKANDNLLKAISNGGKEIEGENGRATYINTLLDAKNAITKAEKDLENAKEKEQFFKDVVEYIAKAPKSDSK